MAIGGDPFRHLGPYEESLGAILTQQRAGPQEPIVAVLHLACPRVEYLDRGKSSVSLPLAATNAIVDLIEGMTSKWAKQRKAEERDRSARARRNERLIRYYRPTSTKDAAYSVMGKAYLAASANDTLPANPRQIMYAARPEILTITGKNNLDDQYFCQKLLPNYIREHWSTCAGWNIAWDDRGHFIAGKRLGLGTLAVRDYLANYAKPSFEDAGFADAAIKTHGPEGRFSGVLYIEKEGFIPLFERAALAEKFDIAIMSCKGMSVTAARLLIDRTCARYGIPLLILHDFDISGFSIAKTLCSDTRRYTFRTSSGPSISVFDWMMSANLTSKPSPRNSPPIRAKSARRCGAMARPKMK